MKSPLQEMLNEEIGYKHIKEQQTNKQQTNKQTTTTTTTTAIKQTVQIQLGYIAFPSFSS